MMFNLIALVKKRGPINTVPSTHLMLSRWVGGGLLALILLVLMTPHSSGNQLTQKPHRLELPFNARFKSPVMQPQVISRAHVQHRTRSPQHINLAPQAIQPGTALEKVTFYGNGITSIIAAADTNNDKIPDGNARETFTAGNPELEEFTALAVSARTQKVYAGSLLFEGTNANEGVLTVLENPTGNFKGTIVRKIPLGKGMPVGIVVKNSGDGDIVIVMSVYYQASPFILTDGDFVSITAYLPGPDGIPDGSRKVDVLPAGQLLLGLDQVAFSFGGMALSQNGNLIANLVAKNAIDGFAGGALFVFTDNDGDGIPDNLMAPTRFAEFSDQNVANLIAATSVVPLAGGKIGVLGADIFSDAETEIFVYTDPDGDGRASDSGTKIFNESLSLPGILLLFEGTSGYVVNRMAGAGDKLIFSFINFQGEPRGSGLASVSISGSTADKAFDVSNSQTEIVTCVASLSGSSSDMVPPTVQVISPNGGETVRPGAELEIRWTSSDDKGVVTQGISLSGDSGNSVSFTVATGLAGETTSFRFVVPNGLGTQNGRIRVTARDSAGNIDADLSDQDFVILGATGIDTRPPEVTVSTPATGAVLTGGTSATVAFTSTDNVGVSSHSLAFAADGSTFDTPLATGLPGSITSFDVTLPNQTTSTGIIRVQAADEAGNIGTGLSGVFTINADIVPPTVTVLSPGTTFKKVKRGEPINVTWTSMDNGTVVRHDIALSTDNGATFGTILATGLPGTAQSFLATAPGIKVKKAIIKVTATDGAGNAGEGRSTSFKVK
ncbi:MAG TPA: hypothetical protein PLB32_13275 [Acidobacteriota bacterium]|nr:hypothetical protein [Acidobacteriota bacterium]